MNSFTSPLTRAAALGAVVVGLGAGSYGIASAASGSGSASTTTPAAHDGWGQQRSDETPLTGDALAQVTAVAKDAVPGATIVRVETDADGNATYEAHVIKSDGTLATVYVDDNFKLVSVQTGGPGGPGGRHDGPPASAPQTASIA